MLLVHKPAPYLNSFTPLTQKAAPELTEAASFSQVPILSEMGGTDRSALRLLLALYTRGHLALVVYDKGDC